MRIYCFLDYANFVYHAPLYIYIYAYACAYIYTSVSHFPPISGMAWEAQKAWNLLKVINFIRCVVSDIYTVTEIPFTFYKRTCRRAREFSKQTINKFQKFIRSTLLLTFCRKLLEHPHTRARVDRFQIPRSRRPDSPSLELYTYVHTYTYTRIWRKMSSRTRGHKQSCQFFPTGARVAHTRGRRKTRARERENESIGKYVFIRNINLTKPRATMEEVKREKEQGER